MNGDTIAIPDEAGPGNTVDYNKVNGDTGTKER